MKFIVDDLIIDSDNAIVTRDGKVIEMPKLSYLLLLELVKNAPTTVSITTLIERVWKGKVVSEEAVHQRVTLLRKIINDCSHNPRYFINIRGQGYKVIAKITFINEKDNCSKDKLENTQPSSIEIFPKAEKKSVQLFRLSYQITTFLIFVYFLFYNFNQYKKSQVIISKSPHEMIADLSDNPAANDYVIRAANYFKRRTPNDTESAIVFLNKALNINPEFALAHAGLARAYYSKYRRISLEVNELNADNLVRLSPQNIQKEIALQKRYQQSANDYADSAIALAQKQGGNYSALAYAYGVKQMQKEELACYLKSIQFNPDNYASYINAARIYIKRKQYNQALKLYFQAIEITPNSPSPFYAIAFIFESVEQPALAEQWYLETLNRIPESISLRRGLCQLYIGLGNYQQAIEMCESILDWNKADARAFEWAGEASLNAGLVDKGTAHYKRAMELDSNYAKFRYASLIRHQQPEVAQPLLEQSLKKMIYWAEQKTDWGDAANLSEYYAAMENKNLAYYWLEEAIKMGFNDHRQMSNTSSYKNIKKEPRFQKIIVQVKLTNQQFFEQIEHQFIQTPSAVLNSIYQ